MNNDILDERTFSKNDIIKALKSGGIERFYEVKNGDILVEESDAVRVAIQLKEGKVSVKPKFPQIGNVAQVVATIVLSLALNIIIGIILGQVFSYFWFNPKIKKLKYKVESVL